MSLLDLRRLPCAVLLSALVVTGCSRPQQAPPPPAPSASALWGDMKPLVSVKELMEYTIDPLSDGIFDAVGTDADEKHVVDAKPVTDADWKKVQAGAVSLGEAIYLLKIPRPFTQPGDENVSQGPNPPEMSPAQIKAKLESDPVLWNAKIEAVRNVTLEVLDIVKKKDSQALFAAGGDLDQACEGCHLQYWYPGEDKRREQRRLGAVDQLKQRK